MFFDRHTPEHGNRPPIRWRLQARVRCVHACQMISKKNRSNNSNSDFTKFDNLHWLFIAIQSARVGMVVIKVRFTIPLLPHVSLYRIVLLISIEQRAKTASCIGFVHFDRRRVRRRRETRGGERCN